MHGPAATERRRHRRPLSANPFDDLRGSEEIGIWTALPLITC